MKNLHHSFGLAVRSIVLMVFVLSTFLQPGIPVTQAGYDPTYGWFYEYGFEPDISVPSYFDLELDSFGYPHLAYYNDSSDNLVYRYYDGTQWLTGLQKFGFYNYISLELDAGDNPHITYYSTTSQVAAYTYYDGATWHDIQITPGQQSSGEFAALALTDGGLPVVVFNNPYAQNISIAKLVGSSFVITEVQHAAISTDAFSFISLQLDENDYPHVSYCYGAWVGGCSQLRYAANNGTTWSIETLDSAQGPGYYSSLALDSAGYPHISYYTNGMGLRYTQKDASGWHPQVVTTGSSGVYSALALDNNDIPSIAYYEQTNSLMKYTYWDGSTWAMNMSPDQNEAGEYMNLEMDAAGNPHLAYWDANGSSLALATYQSLPDLGVTQMWVETADNQLIATVRNDGQGTYSGDLEVELYLDGTYTEPPWGDTPTILPGGLVTAYLPAPTCSTPPEVEVKVCLVNYSPEANDANNCLIETWTCEAEPLAISNFSISAITIQGFTADWTTNRPADTTLIYTTSGGGPAGTFTDGVLRTTHHVVITGLNEHQVYYVRAYSQESGGLLATSQRKTVKTLATPGEIQPPNVTIERMSTRQENFQIKADYVDTSNIQRVEFYMDGQLIGTDFTPTNGQFDMQLSPASHGFTRDGFYTQHDVETRAFNFAGQPYVNPTLFEPVRENFPIESNIITPASESTIYVAGTTVPASTSMSIDVFAQQFEWECEWSDGDGIPVSCGDVANPVTAVRYYINDVLTTTITSPDPSSVYHFSWNISTKPVGDYQIKAVTIASDGGMQENRATLHIVQGQPDLSIQRSVTRLDNVFRVNVTLTNSALATGSAVVSSIEENFKGFQPVKRGYESWSVGTSSILQGKQATATITFAPVRTLNPGQSTTFYYDVIPVLFPDMSTAVYRMGVPQSKINYTMGSTSKTKYISLETVMVTDAAAPGGTSNLAASNARAMASADYLIITAPGALTDLYVMNEVHALMGDMARLAALKQAVLGYWDPALGMNNLNDLLDDNSSWTNRLHPNFESRGHGYVLLVGETEVIPADTTGPFNLYWSGTDGGEDYDVHYTDNTYAHTDGNGAPDLLLGRIIGNSALKLDLGILNSINTHVNGSYERVEAYVGSGLGIAESTMQGDANTVTNTLIADGYTVSKHHWEEEAFLASFPGIDFAQYDGLTHGDTTGDGVDELIWARDDGNQLVFINGSTGGIISIFTLDFEDGDSISAGDVDGDGVAEIVIGDRNDTIRTYEVNGTQIASFSRDFSAWEQVAVGDVLLAFPGDEIVMADDNDYLRIFSYTGLARAVIDIGALGYDFADHDILHIGNLTTDNTAGTAEIVFTDRTHDKIVGITANGDVKREISVDFDYGDNMEVANVVGDNFDDIILADRSDSIRAYTYTSGNDSVQSTHVDVEQYDGLVMRDVIGTLDEIFHFDRGNMIHKVDMSYPDNAVQQFEQNIAGVDLIWFQAHGWAGGMDPTIDVSNFPVPFAGSNPIVTAWSCTTGDYEGNGDNGIAEAFLRSGAGVYIGSTEVSPVAKNSNMSRKLFRDYWEPEGNHTIAESLLWMKNDRWEVSEYYDWWWYTINEYNFYGDPKFDIFASTTLASQLPAQPLAAKESLVIDLPMYSVDTVDGVDSVEIPEDAILGTHGGDLFQDQGEYEVPLYIHTIQIPARQQVKNVTMTARDGKYVEYGLNLPVVDMIPASAENAPVRSALSQEVKSLTAGHDWSPNFEQPFTWSVYEDIDGGSTLTLTITPFYYDPAALYSEYYQHFEFNIETISTSIQIISADTDKPVYSPGDDVYLRLQVENTSEPLDVIVSTTIRKFGSGEVVDGFSLTALDQLTDVGDVGLVWTWLDPAILPGSYTIDILVEDMQGQRLAQRTLEMELGKTAGEVTGFSASPLLFQPGQSVATTLEFTNTGDQPISGLVIIQVQTLAGEIVYEFTQEFTNLPAASIETATLGWDSSSATETDYRLVGYVQYDSQITRTVTVEISTQAKIYLPSVMR